MLRSYSLQDRCQLCPPHLPTSLATSFPSMASQDAQAGQRSSLAFPPGRLFIRESSPSLPLPRGLPVPSVPPSDNADTQPLLLPPSGEPQSLWNVRAKCPDGSVQLYIGHMSELDRPIE